MTNNPHLYFLIEELRCMDKRIKDLEEFIKRFDFSVLPEIGERSGE